MATRTTWAYKPLAEVAYVIDSLHQTPKYSDSGYPMVRVTDVKDGFLEFKNTVRVSEEVFSNFTRKYQPKRGDIVFSRVGTYGNSAYVNTDAPFCLGQNTAVIVPRINNRFLYICIQSPQVRTQIEQSVTGSTQKTISLKDIKSLQIPLPDALIQQRIVDILGSLDDKIALNRQMNETLEQMAMTLYKHWFVDFGPFQDGEVVESELGMIPKWWSIQTLESIANILMGQSPKSEYYNTENFGLPFHQGVTNFNDRFPDHNVFCTQSLRTAKAGDILVSVRAPVGRINIADQDVIIGRGLSAVSHKERYNSFLLYCLKHIFQQEDSMGSGTVFSAINKNDLSRIKVVDPVPDVLAEFDNRVAPIDQLIYSNTLEIRHLIETRDYLLPRVLSGEIELGEAEEEVEEVLAHG